MILAASAMVAFAWTVTAGLDISSSADIAPAFAMPGSGRCVCMASWPRYSSLRSRSASETPMTRPSPSSTGRALTCHCSLTPTISL